MCPWRAKLIIRTIFLPATALIVLYFIFVLHHGATPSPNRFEHVEEIQIIPFSHANAMSEGLEHSNIDTRGKFQQQRIKAYCSKHFSGQPLLPVEPSYEFKRHLMFDDNKRILFCFLPKVGCTNMKRLMLYIGGHLPLNTVTWNWVDDQTYLEPALKHASFLNNSLSHNDKTYRIQHYYKFMILRNPLERLVSAFRDKIEPQLQKHHDNIGERVKRTILNKYRKMELLMWERFAYTTRNISVTFREFIRYVVETDVSELNEHFMPSLELCHPCTVQYNFYGNFQTISSDVKQIMGKFEVDPAYYKDSSLHNSAAMTARLLPMYYKQLPPNEKAKLFAFLYNELAFYYSLYPSEKSLLTELLMNNSRVL